MNTAYSRYPPLLVAVAAFMVRFLRIGAIENDHYVYLARAHEVLHGDWPVRDFVDPGLPLGYLLSAAAAAIGGPTLLTEAVLAAMLFAVAAAVTFVLARRASGSIVVALGAAAIVLILPPRLYNSSKMLVPVVAMLIAWRYADRPAAGRALWLGVWTGVAFLFRHDYALYVAAASAVLLVISHRDAPQGSAARAGMFALGAAILVVPWLAYVQAEEGLPLYFAAAVRFSAAEAQRTSAHWVPIFYVFAALPIVALLLGARGTRTLRLPHVAFAAALVIVSELILLRDEPSARLPDIYASTAVIVAIIAGRFTSAAARRLLNVAAALAAVGIAVTLLLMRPAAIAAAVDVAPRWQQVASRLRDADPAIMPTPGRAALVRFIARCTAPGDRVLVGGFAPELPVLAHRAFAAGLPDWIRGYYQHPDDVARARAQLARERVGAAVMLDGGDAFAAAWPALAADLRARGFVPVFLALPDERIELWLPSEKRRLDPETGLPCAG